MNKLLMAATLALLSLPLQAANVSISCYENLDLDSLKTDLYLVNLDVVPAQEAQYDLCFNIERGKLTVTEPRRSNISMGYGYGRHGRHGGFGGIGYDPFWDSYETRTYEQNYVSLSIKDKNGRPVWQGREVVDSQDKIGQAARTLLGQIPQRISNGE
ncbi:hypothetical protein AB8Q18_10385 [Neisseriaceae bacterium CLB008]|nr:hypothetical protein [Neisseriaceae bacterium]